jgi:hypothetical protein
MKWWDKIPKKLIALIVGGVVQLLPIDADTKHEVTKIVLGFLIGQGLADVGKERAKVAAAAWSADAADPLVGPARKA